MQKTVPVVLLSVSILLASCGPASDKSVVGEKKAKLEALKKQQIEIAQSISTLEEEIVKLDPSSKKEKTKLVRIAAITPINFVHYIDLQGSIESENISYVAPRNGQGGLVKAIYVKKGDAVKKGQLLLKLDDAVFSKSLTQLQTQLNFAQDIYRRQKNLWDQQIGTEVQLIQAKQTVDQITDQIASVKEQQSMTSIYAEVAGIADQVNIRVGEFFSGFMGNAAQITIVNNTDLKVTTQVPETYIERVKTGGNILISLPDVNKTFNATIALTGKTIDPYSRAFYVEAKLPYDKDLKPNQIALVKIQDYAANNAITIPVNTLQNDDKGKFVMVAVTENGKMVARKRTVEVGQLYNDKIEIKTGVQSGEQLITEGFQGLYDGQLLALAD
jgi:RND family efflux transporter MFP subunit